MNQRAADPNSGVADSPEALGRWSRLALLLIIVLGVSWRVERLAALPLFGDEFHSLDLVARPLAQIARSFDQRGTHIALPLMQRICQSVVGPGVFALRLPVLLAGILSLLLCFPLARRFVGTVPALLTTMALALSPMHVFYSRFGRSYVPALLLGLLLVEAARRATDLRERAQHSAWRRWLPVTVLAALLPYVHLSALALVGTVALTSMALSWTDRRRAADLVPPLIAFGAGLLVSGLMYLPAFDALSDYLTRINELVGPGAVQAVDVATLLAGGRLAGFVWLAAVPLAGLWMLRVRARSAVWLLAAMSGPLIGLLLSAPYGMAYAYARYLLVSLPFVWMLLSWALVELLGRKTQIATTLGAGALLAVFFAGPTSPGRSDDFPFANSYLALRELPAFDVPDPDTAQLYRDIANDADIECIIEAPMLTSRAALLYRNARLQHGKRTLIGVLAEMGGPLAELPYVPILDASRLAESGADVLVLHLAVDAELARYWRFVYDEALPATRTPGDERFMVRHEAYTSQQFQRLHGLVPELIERLGEPLYRDALIVAWRL